MKAMEFSVANNSIDAFVSLNERGEEVRMFYVLQNHRILDQKGAKTLSEVVSEALRKSTLGPFIHEYNERGGPVSLETQHANLEMLKFSFCKGGEAAWLGAQADIFPNIQYVVHFIEEALLCCRDGKIPLQHVFDKLTVLKLTSRRISELDNSLAKFLMLQYLNLSWNQIRTLSMFRMPPRLFYLNLEMNLLSDVVLCQAQGTTSCLVYLNLTRNKFTDECDFTGINSLRNLLMLDLSYNEIHELNSLWRDLQPGTLASLSLVGNPCSVTEEYFINVLAHVPQLEYLDCLSIPDDMKTDIQDRADTMTASTSYNEAELSIHCYRVLQFKYVESTIAVIPPPLPESAQTLPDNSLDKTKKSTKIKSPMDKGKSILKGKSVKAKADSKPEPPPVPLVDMFYRFEFECSMLRETLHEFADFVKNAEDKDTTITDDMLEKINIKQEEVKESHEDLFENDENEEHKMTVRDAEKLLEKLEREGSEALNEVFHTYLLTNQVPESPVMEFSPILMKAPHKNLKLLSNMFNTQFKLHFVQLQVAKKKITEKDRKDKKPKGKEVPTEGAKIQNSGEPEILRRKVLHTILLNQVTEPSWAEESIDFTWTTSAVTRAANLKAMNYGKAVSPRKGREVEPSLPLPEELTMHFGISLKRAHNIKF